MHVDKILFTDNSLYGITEVFGNGVSETFAHNLAGVLQRELDFEVFVPIGIRFQLAFSDPFGIIFVDAFYFKVVRNVEFFQSGPDCISDVPSFGTQIDLGSQVIRLLGLDSNDFLPAFVIGDEHAVIFPAPSFAAVSPIDAGGMKNLP